MKRLLTLLLLLVISAPVLADTFPTQGNLRFQTSGPSRPATIGDWYTTAASASTDRRHRFVINVTAEMLAAGNVSVTINDAESNGLLDEVDGVMDATSATTSDPTRFELRAADGVTVLAGQTVPTGSPNGSTVNFTITPAMGVGSYQVISVTGAQPISGNSTASLNDDDNTFTITVTGGSLDILIGSLQGTFQHDAAGTINVPFYFLVGPGTSSLALRNFDGDNGGTVTYRRPNNNTVGGTMSGNGVWNGGGSLNSGQDTISGLSTSGAGTDVGIWGATLNNFTNNNQIALEVLADGSKRIYFDRPPTVAGNFTISPTGTLSTTIGTPVNHPFTVTNLFHTSDIIDFALSGTAANYTVSLRTSGGAALTDTNADGRVDTGILAAGEAKNFILRVTPQAGAGTSSTTRISADSMMDRKVDPAINTVRFIDRTTTIPAAGVSVSGTVYRDTNHDANLQSTESGTGIAGLFVKAVPAAGGNAVAVAAVTAATGVYSLSGIAAGDYVLRLDNNDVLTDTTAHRPAGWVGTEGPNQERSVKVGTAAVTEQDLGLFQGSVISGLVFRDDGSGGGTANDGIRQAGEAGLSAVQVDLLSGGILDETTTSGDGTYRLFAPASAGGQVLTVKQYNLANYVSVGGSAGTTGGTYTLATDVVTFTYAAATAAYTGVNFGDIPATRFLSDNQADVEPGGVAFYTHRFLSGTAGSVTFTQARVANPSGLNWSSVLYRDLDADGILDAGEPIVTGALTVAAGQEVALILKEFVPENAPLGARDQVTLTATLTPAGTSQNQVYRNVDLTTVRANYGVKLTKATNKTTASSGEVITYTITYTNQGAENLNNLVVKDKTPAFTTYVAAGNSALPTGLTGVTIAAPAVGAEGEVTWTFAGSLRPGATGIVTFQVKVR